MDPQDPAVHTRCTVSVLHRSPFIIRNPLSELGVIARGRGLGGNQLKESATPSESVLFRMLQCVPGVSAAKAASVLEYYHSVRELLDAFDQQKDEREKETLLSVGCKLRWLQYRTN